MAPAWVDFAQVKAAVSLRRVLEDYGILARLRQSGKDHCRGLCPIHHGEGRDAFHGDLRKNIFHCFSCGAGGNVLDLVAQLEQCSLREAALQLQRRYLVMESAAPVRPKLPGRDQLVTEKTESNPALSFCLAGLDAAHPYVSARGLSWATATHFGIGFYSGRGIMHGRLAIPIHDEHGRLVAYCGRSVIGEDPAVPISGWLSQIRGPIQLPSRCRARPRGRCRGGRFFRLHASAPVRLPIGGGAHGCRPVARPGRSPGAAFPAGDIDVGWRPGGSDGEPSCCAAARRPMLRSPNDASAGPTA